MTIQCCVCLLNEVRRDAETQVQGYSVCEEHIGQANRSAIAERLGALQRRQAAQLREAQLFARKTRRATAIEDWMALGGQDY